MGGIPRYGRFTFTVGLPCAVDTNTAEAQYTDGILRVRFHKPESSKPVRIQVNTGGEWSAVTGQEPKNIEAAPVEGKKKRK